MASGISSTFRQVGIATGIAGLGAVFQSQVTQPAGVGARRHRRPPTQASDIGRAVTSGGAARAVAAAPPAGRPRLEQAIHAAFTAALNDLLLIAAGVAFVGSAAGVRARARAATSSGARSSRSPSPADRAALRPASYAARGTAAYARTGNVPT